MEIPAMRVVIYFSSWQIGAIILGLILLIMVAVTLSQIREDVKLYFKSLEDRLIAFEGFIKPEPIESKVEEKSKDVFEEKKIILDEEEEEKNAREIERIYGKAVGERYRQRKKKEHEEKQL